MTTLAVGDGIGLRVQRQRRDGWTKPEGAIYIGRPGKWQNPFDWRVHGVHDAVDLFRKWLNGEALRIGSMYVLNKRAQDEATAYLVRYNLTGPQVRELGRKALRGAILMCWCPVSCECHGDVWLAVANVR